MEISTTHLKTVNHLKNYVENSGDCNDSNPEISSLATEVCNGIDDDCDELIDTDDDSWDASSGMVVYLDNDSDGRGNISTREEVCYVLEGYVTFFGW